MLRDRYTELSGGSIRMVRRDLHIKSSNLRFSPTKQIPMLSGLIAVGNPQPLAISLTSDFNRCPSGNSARARLDSEMEER